MPEKINLKTIELISSFIQNLIEYSFADSILWDTEAFRIRDLNKCKKYAENLLLDNIINMTEYIYIYTKINKCF